MTPLDDDIHQYIFHILPISDKRSFLRTCKKFNQLSIHMPLIESEFQKMINNTCFSNDCYHSSLCKYSIELLFDDRKIPNKYIIVENKVMHHYPKIYTMLAKRGNLHLIKKMLNLNRNSFMCDNAEYVMKGAAKVGNIKILRWMIQNNYRHYSSATAYAAKCNQLKTLKWLIDHNFAIDGLAVSYAGGKGHMDIINYLVIDKKCEPDSYFAALNGQLEIVKHFHSIYPNSLHDVCDAAVISGNLDILKFAYENGKRYDDDVCCKHTHILEWLIDNNHIKPNIKISEQTAWTGNLESLQLLHRHNFPILNETVFLNAVSGQNIATIQWLHDMGCPFNKNATDEAGSLAILKLLVGWGCELKNDIYDRAASNGDLEMLQYLQSHGCILTADVITWASRNDHLHVIRWAREQGCPWNSEACCAAVYDHNLDILRWLRGFDRKKSDGTEICPWDEDVCLQAISFGYVDILKFALDNGCKFSVAGFAATKESKNRIIMDCVGDYCSRKLLKNGKK